VHDFERRGVNRIATEVAQEVGMLLEDQDGDPGAREQQSEHHPCRAPAGDAAADRNLADALLHTTTCLPRRLMPGRPRS
jgi:hypothetical protein